MLCIMKKITYFLCYFDDFLSICFHLLDNFIKFLLSVNKIYDYVDYNKTKLKFQTV